MFNNRHALKSGSKRMSRAIALLAGAMVLICAASRATGQPAPARGNGMVADGVAADGKLKLTVNKSTVITTTVPVKRVNIAQPDVADFNLIGPRNILVTAKKMGNTQLILWDENDRSQVIDVSVEFDLMEMNTQLKTMFPGSKIEVAVLNGAIALRGRVPNLQTAEQAIAVASPYAERVLNFLEVSGGQQVMLQVRFAEVSRSATNAMGVNFNYACGPFVGGSNIGQVNPSSRLPYTGLVGDTPPANGFPLDGATTVTPGVTVFGAGQIGSFYFEYFLQALRQNNLLRILAEPNLVAMSGQEANFLAGGEYPIPVTQGGGDGGVAITIEYREFGVRLRFVPVVLGDGRIRLKVAPEVSDLDFTTAVRINGFVVPGLTSRKMETSIELVEGQTLAIAGLLNNTVTSSKDVTPLLGDLPVVGTLFRSVRYQRKETELVVLVTPRLVAGMNPDQVPLVPGENWHHPEELDMILNRNIGGEKPEPISGDKTPQATANSTPARFRGQYGFVPAGQPVAASE
jgi:pilus assembly protein CpaC